MQKSYLFSFIFIIILSFDSSLRSMEAPEAQKEAPKSWVKLTYLGNFVAYTTSDNPLPLFFSVKEASNGSRTLVPTNATLFVPMK